jgi:hypothetical protein
LLDSLTPGADVHLYLGRTTRGEHLYAHVCITPGDPDRTAQSTDHRQIAMPPRLSITWAVARKGAPVKGGTVPVSRIPDGWLVAIGAGAIDYADGRPVRTDARRLAEIGERWQLNDMRAGCVHMGAGDHTGEVCPESGYRWGSAWLVEEIPAEVLGEVSGIVARQGVAA